MNADLWIFDIKGSADSSDDFWLKNFFSHLYYVGLILDQIKKPAPKKRILSGFGIDVKCDPICDIIICWTPQTV